MKTTTITVQENTWKKLIDLKYSLRKRSVDEVIKALLVGINSKEKKK